MPLIEIPGKGLIEFPDGMSPADITTAIQQMTAEERPPGPGAPAGEAAVKPGFFGALGASAKERLGEIGQFPGDLAKFGGDVTRVGSSMVPGPLGGLAAGAGSLAADVMQGESPNLPRAGVAAGTTAALGGLGKLVGPLSRLRLGANPSGGFGKVAAAVGETAPAALRPPTPTAVGLSEVMRGGGGKAALQASRETGIGKIAGELAAGQGASQATAGQQGQFLTLVKELADANRAGFNPVTAQARTGATSLEPLRDRATILQDIQGMLSPEQWAAFQALQKEYAGGSDLLRLFKAGKSGAADPLLNQGALQDRARQIQDRLDPQLLSAIFRGGTPLQGDKLLNVPLGLPMFGSVPTTVQSGGGMNTRLLQMLLQGGGAGLSSALGGGR